MQYKKTILVCLVCAAIGTGCVSKLEADAEGIIKWHSGGDARVLIDNGTSGRLTVEFEQAGKAKFQVDPEEWVILDLEEGSIHFKISDGTGEVVNEFTQSVEWGNHYVYNPRGHYSYVLRSKPYGGVPFDPMGPISEVWHLPAGNKLFSFEGGIYMYFEGIPDMVMGGGGGIVWKSFLNHWTSRDGELAPNPEYLSEKESPFKVISITGGE